MEEVLAKLSSSTKGVYYRDNFISYKEIMENAKKISELIKNSKYHIGRNIGIYIENSIDYITAYLTIIYIQNHTIVPIYRKLRTSYELNNEIDICDISMIIANNESYNELYECIKDGGKYVVVLNITNWEMSFINGEMPYEKEMDRCDILLQSSGTTNNPQKIMHSFQNIKKNMMLHVCATGLSSDEKTLIQIPMTFSYCNTAQMLAHMYLNSDIYIGEAFSPAKFIEQILKYEITNTILVPSQLISLSFFENARLLCASKLKTIFYGGSHLSDDVLLKLMKMCPDIKFVNTYGQTEAGPRITVNMKNAINEKLGSAGKPLPEIEIKILDDNKNITTGIGDIYVHTPCCMLGYYKNPALTSTVLCDEWINTGDIGYMDTDGYLFITGRKKNIIISGGINIYPEEIENILIGFPNVKKAYVYGVPNDLLGEIPAADIEVINSENINTKEILEYCRVRLAEYKIPYYLQIKSIEETLNGKTKRKQYAK